MSFLIQIQQQAIRYVAVLFALTFIAGCTQSFDNDNDNAFKVTPSEETVSINISYWENQCSSCHNDVLTNPSNMGNLSI